MERKNITYGMATLEKREEGENGKIKKKGEKKEKKERKKVRNKNGEKDLKWEKGSGNV